MTVLFLILPLTLVISGLSVAAYLWAARSGQLDDLETPPLRMLRDTSVSAGDRPELLGGPAGRATCDR